ncbi:hypothetical protein VKT23_007957 [Stygiomarasmius scandens]|uniref:SH3 domain-containing protein n=1 Tax=Marasmiellus scandens TaxID=2682957 RepID=A0ABR1JJU4_9AGAR
MHAARDTVNHHRLARLVQDENILLPREPALLNLPVALPSVPLLNPLITPLVAGPTPASSASSPESTPSDPGSSNSGGNSSGNSGGSSSGSSSSAGSGSSSSGDSSGNTGNSGGNSGSNNQGGSSSGNTGGSSNGSAGSSSGNPAPSSAAVGGNSGSSSQGSSSQGSSSHGSSPSQSSSSHGSSGSSSAANGGSHSSASTSDQQTEENENPANVVNVGSDPSISGTLGGHSATLPGTGHAASTSGASSQSGGTSANNGSGASSPGGDDSEGSPSGGLSPGALAGIVVTIAVFAAILFVLCLRRRNIMRRAKRRTRWAGQAISNESLSWGQGMGNGNMSARSSFATTYDISNGSHSGHGDIPALPPTLPPMAEIRDTHGPGFMTHTQQVDYTDATLISPTSPPQTPLINFEDDDKTRRNSVYSNRSTGSDPYSQYLVIREPPNAVTGGNGGDLPTPMSVRPFSPSEAFAFPKPPKSAESAQWASQPSLVDASEPTPNPFSDKNAEFDETEVIRRPFVPTLEDEMRVSVGERVRIVQVFTDGWALIERRAVDDKKGKGTTPDAAVRGLIPVDCFREAGQELPAFLAAKKVGSY